MARRRGSYLNLLVKELPEGLLVDGAWLEKIGIASNLRAYYVKAEWLEQPVRGLYRRPQGEISWEQVVVSLQSLLGKAFVVGGYTALDLRGYTHYVSPDVRTVYLYGPDKPPHWLGKLDLPQRFVYRNSARVFRNERLTYISDGFADNIQGENSSDLEPPSDSLSSTKTWTRWDKPITLSRPERAYLEMLDELPDKESFHQADMLMEGAINFNPRLLQALLVDCRSVKVKRLFFFFADRHRHSWLKRLDKDAIDFGRGKRMLVQGGRLDPNYLITVPSDIDAS